MIVPGAPSSNGGPPGLMAILTGGQAGDASHQSPGPVFSPAYQPGRGAEPSERSAQTGYFTRNDGQVPNPDVVFYGQSGDLNFGFGPSSIQVSAAREEGAAGDNVPLFEIQLPGARRVAPRGEEITPFYSNFLLGRDPSGWLTSVPNYRSITYDDVYPGVDLAYDFEGSRAKYTLNVEAGASIDSIRLRYVGVDELALTSTGDLSITTARGAITDSAPVSFEGGDRPLGCRFTLAEPDEVTFACPDRNPDLSAVIDPYVYMTYLGGGGVEVQEYGRTIELDQGGDAYVTGMTDSVGFPATSGAYGTNLFGGYDVLVAKFNANGSSLEYATYVGGTGKDEGIAILAAPNGSVYVVGNTGSSDFPVTGNAANGSYAGGASDAFVFRLSPAGDALEYSTFLGGLGDDGAIGSAFDPTASSPDIIYVQGNAGSADFPVTPGAYDVTYSGGWIDVFVTRLNTSSGEMEYGTFLGGIDGDSGHSVAIGQDGSVYSCVHTWSADFPTTPGAYNRVKPGGADIAVTKMNRSGASLDWSTFVGGRGEEYAYALTVTAAGEPIVVGLTASNNFPVSAGAWQANFGGVSDGFIFKLSADGTQLSYSTYLGGAGDDGAFAVRLDPQEKVFVTGRLASTTFATSPDAVNATYLGNIDAFLAVFDLVNRTLVYGTYVGGQSTDQAWGVAVDGDGAALIAGWTESTDLPATANAFDRSLGGIRDVFVAKIRIPASYNLTFITDPPGLRLNISATIVSANLTWPCLRGEPVDVRAPSPQLSGGATRYVFDRWADGASASRTIECFADRNYTALFKTEFLVNLTASAANATGLADGIGWSTTASFWWANGSRHALNVTSPQAVGQSRYVFQNWSDGLPQNHSITIVGPMSIQLDFALEHRVFFSTVPPGRQISVDGQVLGTPVAFWWPENSSRVLDAPTPQVVGSSRFQFVDWSSGMGRSHSFTVSATATLSANFSTDFWSVIDTLPAFRPVAVDGAVLTAPFAGWWEKGSTHTIGTVSPQQEGSQRHVFSAWSDNGARVHNVTTQSSMNFTATFGIEFLVGFLTKPTDLPVLVDGEPVDTPVSFWWGRGSRHSLDLETPQSTGDVRYVFLKWSDGGALAHFFNADVAGNLTASFFREFRVTADTQPPNYDLILDDVPQRGPVSFWWRENSTHRIGASASDTLGLERRVFNSWSIGGPRTQNVTVEGPIALIGTVKTEYRWAVSANAPEQQFVLDGAPFLAPRSFWFEEGATHEFSVPPPQTTGKTRYVFGSWADGNLETDRTVHVTGAGNLSIVFDKEFQVTIESDPQGLSLIVDGSPVSTPQNYWWKDQSTHALDVVPDQTLSQQPYRFGAWSDRQSASHSILVRGPLNVSAVFEVVPAGVTTTTAGFDWSLILVLASAGVIGALVVTRRRRGAPAAVSTAVAPAREPAEMSMDVAPDDRPQAVPEPGGVPCPQCGSFIASMAPDCPACGQALVWG